MAGIVITGLPGALTKAGLLTLFQQNTQDSYRGRVFGAFAAAEGTAVLAGTPAGGTSPGRLASSGHRHPGSRIPDRRAAHGRQAARPRCCRALAGAAAASGQVPLAHTRATRRISVGSHHIADRNAAGELGTLEYGGFPARPRVRPD
jgi:hypothetical protein